MPVKIQILLQTEILFFVLAYLLFQPQKLQFVN